jgi:hypothetical protein
MTGFMNSRDADLSKLLLVGWWVQDHGGCEKELWTTKTALHGNNSCSMLLERLSTKSYPTPTLTPTSKRQCRCCSHRHLGVRGSAGHATSKQR